ncbi:hypothetical protein AKJ16_DCAP20507 [Drosera capensis]
MSKISVRSTVLIAHNNKKRSKKHKIYTDSDTRYQLITKSLVQSFVGDQLSQFKRSSYCHFESQSFNLIDSQTSAPSLTIISAALQSVTTQSVPSIIEISFVPNHCCNLGSLPLNSVVVKKAKETNQSPSTSKKTIKPSTVKEAEVTKTRQQPKRVYTRLPKATRRKLVMQSLKAVKEASSKAPMGDDPIQEEQVTQPKKGNY